MSDRPVSRTRIVLLVAVTLAVAALFVWPGHPVKRSLPGRVVRYFLGEAGAHQIVNDLVQDIREAPALRQLQPWGVETIARFRTGTVATNGRPDSIGSIRLAPKERPTFVTKQWGLTNKWGEEEPELSVRLSTNGQPECVVIAWYLHGIVIGLPDYSLSFQPWYYAQARPGVYVYHLYK
jgi:hypothetical protein